MSRLPQNENVHRHHTSESAVTDLRRPDRHTDVKVLVKKTYNFVELLWAMYIAHNSVDLRYVYMFICVQPLLVVS